MCWVCGHCILISSKWGILLLLWVCLLIKYVKQQRVCYTSESPRHQLSCRAALFRCVDTSPFHRGTGDVLRLFVQEMVVFVLFAG